jgi:hypothetical protein
MIKQLIIVTLILILVLIYRLCSKENFHDKTNSVSSNEPEVIENCESCSYCVFNPNPETKDYIISRCLSQHTASDNNFKPTHKGCKEHKILGTSSGCKKAINHYIDNIENLKLINKNNAECSCMYLQDDTISDQNTEKNAYKSWIETF